MGCSAGGRSRAGSVAAAGPATSLTALDNRRLVVYTVGMSTATDAEFDDPLDHVDHELEYVETGTDWRKCWVEPDGRVIVGKSTGWDASLVEVRCLTCERPLELEIPVEYA